jgi:hypothetical protein
MKTDELKPEKDLQVWTLSELMAMDRPEPFTAEKVRAIIGKTCRSEAELTWMAEELNLAQCARDIIPRHGERFGNWRVDGRITPSVDWVDPCAPGHVYEVTLAGKMRRLISMTLHMRQKVWCYELGTFVYVGLNIIRNGYWYRGKRRHITPGMRES